MRLSLAIQLFFKKIPPNAMLTFFWLIILSSYWVQVASCLPELLCFFSIPFTKTLKPNLGMKKYQSSLSIPHPIWNVFPTDVSSTQINAPISQVLGSGTGILIYLWLVHPPHGKARLSTGHEYTDAFHSFNRVIFHRIKISIFFSETVLRKPLVYLHSTHSG